MDKEVYTVKEVANRLCMTEHTVRYYCDKGLVPTLLRDKNNNRLFTQESINWLTGVKHLKECGMSIESIKKYIDLCLIGDSTTKERYSIIKEQKSYTQIQLRETQERLNYLDQKLKHYNQILTTQLKDDMNPSKW